MDTRQSDGTVGAARRQGMGWTARILASEIKLLTLSNIP